MGPNFDLEATLLGEPVLVTQERNNELYFDWIHTPGRPECEEILEWFAEHNLKPFIAEQNIPGGSEWAGYSFAGEPALAALFKLRFG